MYIIINYIISHTNLTGLNYLITKQQQKIMFTSIAI